MSGMETLGRMCNVIPVAAGQAFKVRSASVVQVTCTIAAVGSGDTFTVQQAATFAGVYAPVATIKNVYWTTALNGTAAWGKLTYVSGVAPFTNGPLSAVQLGTGGTTGLVTALVGVFHIFTSELSDPNSYLKITVGGPGLVQVYLGDLVHQRGPANMEILGS